MGRFTQIQGSRYRYVIAGLILAAHLCIGINVFAVSPVLLVIIEEYGISRTAASLLVALAYIPMEWVWPPPDQPQWLSSARSRPLVVAGAFHSRLMEPAREGLAKIVDALTFNEPSIPIVANCTGLPLTTVEEIKQELTSGICTCVRWKDSVGYMTQAGITTFYEIGPGKVLSGMVKRINADAEITNISDPESIQLLTT
ncbi:MAG: ACP S-malonyltransferase [Candidatus Marinimicrobia bacterium]|nr:ACP S-malonyltransferase [Candidatus Neomarinimicrobiota bacterium]